MKKKGLIVGASVAILLGLVGFILYAENPAPAVPKLSAEEAAETEKPYVVKLHAQWCPICMATKGVWSQIQETYADRVRLVVFDFTDEATTHASAIEAHRLGLEKFFAENSGVTGTVVVLHGRTKESIAWIRGSRDFDEYRHAIDAALKEK